MVMSDEKKLISLLYSNRNTMINFIFSLQENKKMIAGRGQFYIFWSDPMSIESYKKLGI